MCYHGVSRRLGTSKVATGGEQALWRVKVVVDTWPRGPRWVEIVVRKRGAGGARSSEGRVRKNGRTNASLDKARMSIACWISTPCLTGLGVPLVSWDDRKESIRCDVPVAVALTLEHHTLKNSARCVTL